MTPPDRDARVSPTTATTPATRPSSRPDRDAREAIELETRRRATTNQLHLHQQRHRRRSVAEDVFELSTASREAREKMALLERRMTSAERVVGRETNGRMMMTGAKDGRVERCAMEDSASDDDSREVAAAAAPALSSSDEENAEDVSAYGVVASGGRSVRGGGDDEGGAEATRARAGDGAAAETTKKRRRRGSTASEAENEAAASGGGGLARSRRHPSSSSSGKRAANVSLLEKFENSASRPPKATSPAARGPMTPPEDGRERVVVTEAEKKIRALEEKLVAVEKEREAYERGCEELRAANNELRNAHARANEARKKGVHKLAVNMAALERKQMRMQIAEEGLRLGTIGVQRVGSVLQEVWEDGRAFHELDERFERLAESRKLAEEKRKQVKKKLPPPGSAEMNTAAHAEYVLSEEVHKSRVAIIRKEEEAIKTERESLEREKAAHIRALKRVRDEDGSRFNDHPVLGDRYVLMNLLGRGGFSEVYKAWDSVEMREVACKLHQLNPQWSEERKRTYVRHAARECDIHKSLDHPHVVRLIDVFEVDSDSFCTVLELCTGDDLDARLKAQGSISEREARAILAQVFNGLAYMSTGPKRIIHYDLKPGNILFDDAGRVKITDFGLSKIMEERSMGFGADTGMELTSQGAGTYWYLPPECFETGPAPPKISSKVDTWSCGVILFQMIYGKRPFGHDMSQEQILHAGTIRNAKEVEFPSKPSISPEGKAFITRCLAYKQSERPDVLEASQDPYMTFLTKKKSEL